MWKRKRKAEWRGLRRYRPGAPLGGHPLIPSPISANAVNESACGTKQQQHLVAVRRASDSRSCCRAKLSVCGFKPLGGHSILKEFPYLGTPHQK